MTNKLNICIFAHSWRSDWNHGNAHFLRGLASALVRKGHQVRCFEPENSWSYRNLLSESERAFFALAQFRQAFPELDLRFYSEQDLAALEGQLRSADVVIVHEWNDPRVVNHILDLKPRLKFRALFHDTHHRAYSNPREIAQMKLESFDGVLAFGDALRRVYRQAFNVQHVWTFHEAADIAHFRPLLGAPIRDVVWIGNWGDEERRSELETFLLGPLTALRRNTTIYGVRYPLDVRDRLKTTGIQYGGYLPNLCAPTTYGASTLCLHIPRRFYSNGLSGVPTIRVFEALACGIPLICSPWADNESLFQSGSDYVVAQDGDAMKSTITWLLRDEKARQQIADHGLATIRRRHTCEHRSQQLLDIIEELER